MSPGASASKPGTEGGAAGRGLLARWGRRALWLLAAFVLAELALRLVGLAFTSSQALRNLRSSGRGGYTVLCLGDSMTAFGGDHAYPRLLEELLNQRGQGLRFHVINEGHPASDSNATLAHLDEHLEEHQPDIVTVMMGVNDDQRGLVELNQIAVGGGWGALLAHLRLFRLARLLSWRADLLEAEKKRAQDMVRSEQRLRGRMTRSENPIRVGLELAGVYRRQDRREKAEELLKQLLSEDPSDLDVRLSLAEVTEDAALRDSLLEGTLQLAPYSHRAYQGLEHIYALHGRQDEIEGLLRLQLQMLPDAQSHNQLATHLRYNGRYQAAEELFLASLQLKETYFAWYQLGMAYRLDGRLSESEQALRRSLELGSCASTWAELGKTLVAQGRLDEAEAALLTGVEQEGPCAHVGHTPSGRAGDRNQAHVELARLYRQRGEDELALSVIEKGQLSRMTVRNYQELAQTVSARVGRLVVVQYPMWSIEPLKAMLPRHEGMIFADNERSFLDGVAREGYGAHFVDHCGIDFGHGTARGNALIAENIARELLEVFFSVTWEEPD